MKYLINLSIIFDVDKKCLSFYDDEKIFIDLTNPAARLLIELIKNNGSEITRDNLLTRVWTDYGFADSNASLNNCISELRKAFSSLGMAKKVILTIPKVGFMIDAEVQAVDGLAQFAEEDKPTVDKNAEEALPPSEADSPAEEKPTANEPAVDEIKSDSPFAVEVTEKKPAPELPLIPPQQNPILQQDNKPSPPKSSKKQNARALTLLLAAAIGTAAISTFLFYPKSATVFLYQEDQCTVSTLDNTDVSTGIIQRAKAQIAEQNVDCKTVRRDIFYVEQKYKSKLNNITLLSVCDVSDNDRYSHCQNFKKIE
ncbi:winged helix-turn-helix domain-containing protein [Serratia quinivorans]|uniref:winged helix-turn-helix domain-containing protein n=1 Tax=Serratia quinivorans TaxID=137545 RepID=UPI0021782DBE|nr:winged helix-turn-helix domain-containing protein [Serratia quinivorans]CAI1595489.1 Transcriptional regulatory protein, C terminal [Serratia quinivorans]CAI1675071.1 Transcriptional regulatory protein, C terminal [Serratia quinivorans]